MPKKRRKLAADQTSLPLAGAPLGAAFTLKFLVLENGSCPLKDWLRRIRDPQTRQRIEVRLDRIERGSLGDCKPVGEGVFELRLDFGAGYRIYYAQAGTTLIVLLCGGDKSTQNSDIQTARALWKDYKNDASRHQ